MTEPTELVPAGTHLPDAPTLTRILRTQLEALVAAERESRGTVHLPEDVYPMVRSLGRVDEGLADYSRAFGQVRRELATILEEEIIGAVGEQDGIPAANLTVPDMDGTALVVRRQTNNTHVFSTDALLTAVASFVLSAPHIQTWISAVDAAVVDTYGEPEGIARSGAGDFLADLLREAMAQLLDCGQFTPQVTKVRAFLAELHRMPGGDSPASTVTSTYRKKVEYRGVRVERERPK